jgi:protocatechuate 3,4-dioxygenase beta subunit
MQMMPVKEKETLREIHGEVFANAAEPSPLEGVVVEVYDNPDVALHSYPSHSTDDSPEKAQKRLAACKTGVDGRFCFPGIPPGRYEVRVSKELWQLQPIIIKLDPRSRRSSKKGLRVMLHAGV